MRLFNDLPEAIREIRRDLSKSPITASHRVQHLQVDGAAHEALGYTYGISNVPIHHGDALNIAIEEGHLPKEMFEVFYEWLENERQARLEWSPGEITELQHPWLKKTLEGYEPSYTYTDRLWGAMEVMENTLRIEPTSRRAYWPIFHADDSLRAPRLTRIPCSLGYQVLIRESHGKRILILEYLQRSCDFKRFWLSDVWLASNFQRTLAAKLEVEVGPLIHHIISFHNFESEEIY